MIECGKTIVSQTLAALVEAGRPWGLEEARFCSWIPDSPTCMDRGTWIAKNYQNGKLKPFFTEITECKRRSGMGPA